MDFIYNKLKAVAAAVAAAGLYWVNNRYGIELGLEIETTIVGAIMGLVVYFVPNLKPSGAAIKQV